MGLKSVLIVSAALFVLMGVQWLGRSISRLAGRPMSLQAWPPTLTVFGATVVLLFWWLPLYRTLTEWANI